MSEKSLYLEEDHVFEFREKRDIIKLLNLKLKDPDLHIGDGKMTFL